jgi:GntR family transcriptional regulator
MLIDLDLSDGRPLYQQIVDEVRRAVALGDLGPEEPLPSVRALATRLRVNPNTVQQAYRELERAGVVYSRRGQGTFARPDGVDQRALLLRDVAERALKDAHRFGFTPRDLVAAVLRAAGDAVDPNPSTGAGS